MASSTTSRCAGVPSARDGDHDRGRATRPPCGCRRWRAPSAGRVRGGRCAVGSTTSAGPAQAVAQVGAAALVDAPCRRRRRRSRPHRRRRSPAPAPCCRPVAVVQVMVAVPAKSWSVGGVARPARRGGRPPARRRSSLGAGRCRDRPRHRDRRQRAERDRRRSAQQHPLVRSSAEPGERADRREHADGSPLSEPCAPCCATTAATLGETSLRCGTTMIATTAATAAAAAASHPAPAATRGVRAPRDRPGDRDDDLVGVRRRRRRRRRRARGRASQNPAGASRVGTPRSASRAARTSASSSRHSADASSRASTSARSDVGELAVEVGREHVGHRARSLHVAHGPVTPSATSAARSRRRPRWMRDRTVPMGTPVASAICS